MFGKAFPSHWTLLQKMLLLRAMKGGGISWATVSGSSPLALVNSLAHSIKSLVQYGKCVQDGTPTPSDPVDILCNNGALRYGAMGSNLYDPSTAVFEVGYYYAPAADGAQTTAQNNFIYHAYIPIEAGAAYVFYGRKQSDNRLSQYNRIHWYDAEKTYISTNTYTAGTIGTGVAPDNAVYAKLSCNPQGASTAITEETVLSYNWTFRKGTEEVTPFEPFVGGVKPVGTPETLTVSGINLLNTATNVTGKYISTQGSILNGDDAQYTALIPVVVGETYMVSLVSGRNSGKNRLHGYDANGQWVKQIVYVDAEGKQGDKLTMTATIDSGISFVRLSYGITDTNAMVEEGSTVSDYQPYVQPQTVTDIPMLLSVGDYKDELEFVGGSLTHRIAIKVFDGTETPTAMSTAGAYRFAGASSGIENLQNTMVLCTHYKPESPSKNVSNMDDLAVKTNATANNNIYFKDTSCQTAADLQAKFAALYAAGTPVILLVVLADETTAQTTPHSLHTTNGTTVVDVESPVGSVELKVEYMAGGVAA